jgi:hypothetical protein
MYVQRNIIARLCNIYTSSTFWQSDTISNEENGFIVI